MQRREERLVNHIFSWFIVKSLALLFFKEETFFLSLSHNWESEMQFLTNSSPFPMLSNWWYCTWELCSTIIFYPIDLFIAILSLVFNNTANIILAQSTLFTGLFFHCPSAVIITLFYYLHEIHAKKCIISALKLVKMAIFSL